MQGILPASDVSPRILLIDDERRILDFVARGLRGQGYAVDAAADAPDGLRMAVEGGYDLVILDLLMPGLVNAHFHSPVNPPPTDPLPTKPNPTPLSTALRQRQRYPLKSPQIANTP